MLFGHQRILTVTVIAILVGLSTLLGDKLQDITRLIPVPGFRRLLPEVVRGG